MNQNSINKHPIADALRKANYGNYPDLSKIRRCLIIKFANIGDVLLTTPLFSCLNDLLDENNIELDALVYKDTEPMLRHNRFIKHVYAVNRKETTAQRIVNEISLVKLLRSRKYDLVLNMNTGDRGALLGYLSGAGIRISYDPRGKGMLGKRKLSTHLLRYPLKPRHIVEMNLDFLRFIGIHPKPSSRQMHLDPGDNSRNSIEIKLNESGITLSGFSPIIIAPTSRWRYKLWGVDRFVELIDHLQNRFDLPIVIVGGEDPVDKEIAAEIVGLCKAKLIDLTGKTTLLELAALTERGKLFVGVDSAPMHIAAAMRIPTVAIFGPTDSDGWAPWDNGKGYCKVVAMRELSCLPCGLAGCVNGKVSDCLVNLPVERVVKAIDDVIDSGNEL